MTTPRIRRRTLLAGAAASLSLAGCQSQDGDGSTPTPAESDTPTETDEPTASETPATSTPTETPAEDTDTPTPEQTTEEPEYTWEPDVSIASLSDEDTVDGTVTVQVEATDEEDEDDSLDVEVAVDAGSWQSASYNGDSGYYEFDWDTSDEEDGDHTIYARATDSHEEVGSSDPVTVYVGPADEPSDQGDFDAGIRHSLYEGPVGGGDGMPSSAIHSADDADIVVSDGDLQSAVDEAERGDVIYVEGEATAHTIRQPEITIAGNRGEGDDGRINDPNISARNVTFDGLIVDVSDNIEISERGWTAFNCEISGAGYLDLDTDVLYEPDVELKQCEIHDLETYKSIQGGYMTGDDLNACGTSWHVPGKRSRIRIVYCDWYNTSKISGTQYYFEVTDNHFHGNGTAGTFLELRAPNACRISGSGSVNACGSPTGTAIIDHNLNEMESDSQGGTRLVQVRGTPPRDTTYVRNNEAPVNSDWDAGCEANDTFGHATFDNQIVLQNGGDAGEDTLDNVVVENNELSS